MNTRAIPVILFLASILAIGTGYLLRNPSLIGLCQGTEVNCLNEFWRYGVASPLYWSTYLLPPLFLVLIFMRKEVFSTWWKVFLPLAALGFVLIIISPPIGSPLQLTPGRTEVTEWVVWFLVGVSALVIAWKYWRLRTLAS